MTLHRGSFSNHLLLLIATHWAPPLLLPLQTQRRPYLITAIILYIEQMKGSGRTRVSDGWWLCGDSCFTVATGEGKRGVKQHKQQEQKHKQKLKGDCGLVTRLL